jgi:hypothetical protein
MLSFGTRWIASVARNGNHKGASPLRASLVFEPPKMNGTSRFLQGRHRLNSPV